MENIAIGENLSTTGPIQTHSFGTHETHSQTEKEDLRRLAQ